MAFNLDGGINALNDSEPLPSSAAKPAQFRSETKRQHNVKRKDLRGAQEWASGCQQVNAALKGKHKDTATAQGMHGTHHALATF